MSDNLFTPVYTWTMSRKTSQSKPSFWLRVKKKLAEHFFDSWWVVLFALFCYSGFEAARVAQKKEYRLLLGRLEKTKQGLAKEQKRLAQLEANIKYLEDPHSLELRLVRDLGLVPEGQIKVYFEAEP